MTLHNAVKRKNNKALTFKIAITAVFLPTAVMATTVREPVVQQHTGRTASTVESIDNTVRQTNELTRTQTEAIGQPGSGDSLLDRPSWQALSNNDTFRQNMLKYGFDMCAINLCQVGNNPTTTTDVNEAREWALRTFYANELLNNDQENDLQEVRRRAIAYTATNGLAISTTIHNELVSQADYITALENSVKSASNYRQDIQAVAGIQLQVYKATMQQLAVLTAMLDIQATHSIQATNIYHEDGSKDIPDAYIASDYRSDGLRQKVTVPVKGTAN